MTVQFEESKHPRDRGKFAHKGGADAPVATVDPKARRAAVVSELQGRLGKMSPADRARAEAAIESARGDATAGAEKKYGPPKGNWRTPTELPGPNKGALPKARPFRAPPLPQAASAVGGKAGGYSASGLKNSNLGDLAEKVLGEKAGFKSLLPNGVRQNPLDLKWDDGDQAFEVKACSVQSQEYKSAPKGPEVEAKKDYARQYGYGANLIIAVVDTDNMTIHAYMRRGEVVGSLYKGGSLNDRAFEYIGSHRFSAKDVAATAAKGGK